MGKALITLALLLLAFLGLQFLLPLRTAVQIGADEGFELAKATLCVHGHQLYSEVWKDQPPLHTFLVTETLKHVSPSILGPRLITTGFTLLLLASVFLLAWRVSGLVVAVLATGLLMASPGFVELSSSCMLEIPALACAVAALCVLSWSATVPPRPVAEGWESKAGESAARGSESRLQPVQKGHAKGWARNAKMLMICAAGVLFAIAFQMKLDTVILLPLAALVVWQHSQHPKGVAAISPGLRGWPVRLGPSYPGEQTQKNLSPSPPAVGGEGRACHAEASERRRREEGLQSRVRAEGRPLISATLKNLLLSLLLLGTTLALTFVAIDWFVDGGAYLRHFGQSWASHFASAKSFEYGSASEHPFDWSILLRNWDTTLPAILGVLICARQIRETAKQGRSAQPQKRNLLPLPATQERGEGRGEGCLPVVWLALNLAIFATHKPWWSYYYIHIAIPLCWCAAIGIQAVWQFVSARKARAALALLAVYGLCAAPWIGGRVYLQIAGIRNLPQTYNCLVLGEMERLKPYCQWMYAAEPIYSFHAGIPMPPPLAVVPLKRLWSGDMTAGRIAAEMLNYKPGIILLANDGLETPVDALLSAEYRQVFQDQTHRLYAHKSIASKARR